MTVRVDTPHPPTRSRTLPGALLRRASAAARATPYCAALIPVALAALLAAAAGRAGQAVRWWHRLGARWLGAAPRPRRRPGSAAVLGHAVLSLLLGMAALLPLGAEALLLLRGVLYGLVDRGPYTNAWGGPSLAGAWLVHLLVSVPFLLVALLALAGIAALHRRLTGALDGARPARWPAALVLAVAAVTAGTFVAWLHQLPG